MAKKPKIEVDESLVKQVIAGQLPITTKVTRVIPEQIPSGTATDAIPAEPPSVPEIDTEKIPDETPSVPAAQEPRRRRTPPLSDYERMFLTPVEYGIRATLYVNASTRFTDGGAFGFGAEMGISTQKIHARGPIGLNELVTIKYVVRGNGQIRG